MNRLKLILIIACFFSCSEKEKIPSDVLPPKKMQEVMWDYLRADSYSSRVIKLDSSASDTAINFIFQDIIFKHHRIKREDFTRSYDYYISHPELMMPLLDSMVAQKSKSDYGNLFKDRMREFEKRMIDN